MTSNGCSFSGDASCGFAASTDRLGAPQLGALADNGGPTPTRKPLPGSPLLDAVDLANCNFEGIITDQRGVGRPQGPGCDVGAVEVEPSAPPPIPLQPRFTG